MSTVMQYVVVRSDLITALKWNWGAVIAQACHACTAAIHTYYDDEHTKKYLGDIHSMHKVILSISNEADLMTLHKLLSESQIKHFLWMEQPENIPTCIALKPYPKEEVQSFVKPFKLLK